MAKAKTTIKIAGEKLRSLLEDTTGKTIYQIAEESGYSKNVLSNAIHNGYASSAVQNIARLYGIAPDAYKAVEVVAPEEPIPSKELTQISIDDMEYKEADALPENFKALIKETVKEAIVEALSPCVRVTGIEYDPIYKRFKLFVNEEDLK